MAVPQAVAPREPSHLSPAEVGRHVAAAWDVATPLQVELLRASWNDTYLVVGADGTRRILRCSVPEPATSDLPYPFHGGGQPLAALVEEARLLEHLHVHAGGVAVARALPTHAGDRVLPLPAVDGTRHLMLFTFAPGVVLAPHPFVRDDWSSMVGAALGRLHAVAATAPPFIARPPRDRRWLLDVPLQVIRAHLAGQTEMQAASEQIAAVGAQTADALDRFAGAGLPWGVLHGDAFNSNASITAAGVVTWYDFDLSGPGWPARDLAGAWSCLQLPNVDPADRARRWDLFLRAYLSANPLAADALAVSLQAIPTLRTAGQINSIAMHLVHPATRRGGGVRDAAWWGRALAALDAAQADTLRGTPYELEQHRPFGRL